MNPKTTPGTGNKVMSKKQKKVHDLAEAEKSQQAAEKQVAKEHFKEICFWIDLNIQRGNLMF